MFSSVSSPSSNLVYIKCVLVVCSVASVLCLDVPRKTNTAVSGFTAAEKTAITNIHNAYRSAVDPTAQNMLEVQWSDEISVEAQKWANQCTGDHSPGASRIFGRWRLAENLYWYFGSSYNELNGVAWWYDESAHFTYATGGCTAICGHYTIMTTADIDYIGCGISHCNRLTSLTDSRSAFYMVCMYNFIHYQRERFYLNGKPCSSCPSGTRCRHRLCVPNNITDSQGYDGDLSVIGIGRPSLGEDNAATSFQKSKWAGLLALLLPFVFHHLL